MAFSLKLAIYMAAMHWSCVISIQVRSTPMDKVVSLLKDLSRKLAAEGALEAAQYDKYACFCKEQVDEKQYAVERSGKRIKSLRAEIEALETSRVQFINDQQELTKSIAKFEASIESVIQERGEAHRKYLAKAKDVDEAINGGEDAIDALKNSKKQMLGAKTDLRQVTESMTKAISRQPSLAQAPKAASFLAKLSEGGEGGRAPVFVYQSNDIISVLEDLVTSFREMKKNIDQDDAETNAVFDKKRLGYLSQVSSAKKETEEKESMAEDATEKLQNAKVSKEELERLYYEDGRFLADLQLECENKAKIFDERSQSRSSELTALSKATAELEKGAAPNYKVHEEMFGLQISDVRHILSPVTLAQFSSQQHRAGRSGSAFERVQNFLAEAADRVGSVALSNLALRARTPSRCSIVCSGEEKQTCQKYCPDPYANIRSMIKDLLQKLHDDYLDELSRKHQCDKAMKERTADRDSANEDIETTSANLDILKNERQIVEGQIQALMKDLAEIRKAALEFNELDSEDAKVRRRSLRMATEGIDAVKFALETLNEQLALVQTKSQKKVKPDQHTITGAAGLAAESFDRPYSGTPHAETEGILGILEIVLDDFQRSKDALLWDQESADRYKKEFEQRSQDAIKERKKALDGQASELSKIKAALLDEEQALRDSKTMLNNTLTALSDWKASCVKATTTWEERKQKRDEEIEALKQAQSLLDEWQQ